MRAVFAAEYILLGYLMGSVLFARLALSLFGRKTRICKAATGIPARPTPSAAAALPAA